MKLLFNVATLASGWSSIALVLLLLGTSGGSFANAASEECVGGVRDSDTITKLDILNSNITTNTLHLAGGEIRFDDIGIVRDRPVSLVVTITEGDYTDIEQVWIRENKDEPEKMNGKKEGSQFANINLQTVRAKPKSGEGNFRMCFVDTETNEPTTVEEFSWTVYDLDERGMDTRSRPVIKEKLILDTTQARFFTLWPNRNQSEVALSCEDGSDAMPCPSGVRTVFHSTKKGTGKDNPEDPDELTDLQKSRSVTFTFVNTECWEFTYDHYCPADQIGYSGPANKCKSYSGGNFLFSGDSDITNDGECLVPPPTPQPTFPPTESPTVSPTDAATLSPTLAPTRPPTVSPTESPIDVATLSPTLAPTRSPTLSPTESIYPTSASTEMTTDSPTVSPTEIPTYATTASTTDSTTDSPTVSPTEMPTYATTASTTELNTDSPTPSPTISESASPTRSRMVPPTDSPTSVEDLSSCPGDIALVTHTGSTNVSLPDAIEIVAQNTSTVTVALHHAWAQQAPSSNANAIDSIFYSFRKDAFNPKCYEATEVEPGTTYDVVNIVCDHLVPIAYLTVCVADDVAHGVLGAGDNNNNAAVVPKCCHPEFETGERAVVCYNVRIRCATGCNTEDTATMTRQRALRGGSAA